MEKYLLAFLVMFPFVMNGQQLIANGDFEENNVCSEFNAACAPEAWFRIPPVDLNFSFLSAHKAPSGKFSEFVVIENIYDPISKRVFLYTKLLCPLIKDQEYLLSFYISPVNIKSYQFGILFNDRELISRHDNPIGVKPSIIISEKDAITIDSTSKWEKIEVRYLANGTETFMTIGNFEAKIHKQYKLSDRVTVNGDVVCLIDDMQLIPADSSNYTLCEEADNNKKLLYATDERHTYKKGVLKPKQDHKKLEPKKEKDLTEISKELKFEIPDIAFDFDQHTIRPEYIPVLDSLVQTIVEVKPYQIAINGHTDSRGSEAYNIILSEKRATSLKVFILQKLKDFKEPILVEGFGESQPKSTNATAIGRAHNRRVVIILSID